MAKKEVTAVSAAMALTVALAASSAAASPTFPPEVQDQLQLGCTPQCILCHNDNNGGFGTLNPFGLAMRDEYFLTPGDVASVGAALDAASGADSDFDADGQLDIDDELAEGFYPASDQRFCGEGAVSGPRYGCGARLAPSPPPRPLFGAAALLGALGALVWRRRRAPRG